MTDPLRLAFFGSPAFAQVSLDALIAAGHRVEMVYAQPPKPSGRGQRLTPCPVHARAEALGLPVRTPRRLRDPQEWASFAALELDAAIVAAYGLMLPSAMLHAPRRGCLNVHASLLPRWRGAAPIQAAVLAGDGETGITVMQMDEGLDTGPTLLREATPITASDTARDLHDRLAEIGARLVLRALAERPDPVPQPEEGVTYAAKLDRNDGAIDWTRSADAIDRQIRALTPWPGTRTTLPAEAGDTPVLKILAAHPVPASGDAGRVLDDLFTVGCGTGALRLDSVQLAGRAAVDGSAFLRGHHLPPGTRLGAPDP